MANTILTGNTDIDISIEESWQVPDDVLEQYQRDAEEACDEYNRNLKFERQGFVMDADTLTVVQAEKEATNFFVTSGDWIKLQEIVED